jgi:DNA gyrase subunit A
VYWLKVYEIPDVSAAGKGKHVGNLVSLQAGETVRNMLAVRNLEEPGRHVFFATRNGTVKKTELKDFSNVMSRGIIAIGIDKDDELVGTTLTDGNQIIFLASHDGQAIRFDENDVRSMGRPAYGVRGMNLDKGDYIVGMATTPKDVKKAEAEAEKVKAKTGVEATATDETIPVKGSLILSVTEGGFGKRTPADEYRLQGRGGSGVINVKTTERNGKVVGIAQVTEESEVMLISHYGKIIRMDSSTIRESGRAAQGVRLLQLEPGDRVAAAVVIPPEGDNGNGSGTLIQ